MKHLFASMRDKDAEIVVILEEILNKAIVEDLRHLLGSKKLWHLTFHVSTEELGR